MAPAPDYSAAGALFLGGSITGQQEIAGETDEQRRRRLTAIAAANQNRGGLGSSYAGALSPAGAAFLAGAGGTGKGF